MTFRAVPAGDVNYESSGLGYERHRRSDPRIAQAILSALGDAGTVVNVGAGAGSYEPTDRYVLAVEPSAAMRARRRAVGAMPAIDASAQLLPLDDDAVDAALAVLTVHQWGDALVDGLREMRRVASGPAVILTLDSAKLEQFWLNEYLPTRTHIEQQRFPVIESIRQYLAVPAASNRCRSPWIARTDSWRPSTAALKVSWTRQSAPPGPPGNSWIEMTSIVDSPSSPTTYIRSWDSRHGHLREALTYTGPLNLVIAKP